MADQKYNILLTASDETKAAFDTARRNIDQVSESILSLKQLAISAGVVSIAAFAKSSIDAGDDMFILSQKTGIAVENLAGLQLAAKMNGASLEDVAVGVKKLSTYLFDAEAGGQAQITMLHLLGVTAREPLPAMEQLADKFAGMNDGAEKSALAVKLFGKSGQDMIPMLNGGSAALRDMIDEGKRLNPITAEFAAQSNAFVDNLDRIHTQAKGNAFVFSNELLPALNDISVAILKSSGNSEAFAAAGDAVAIAMKGAAIGIGTVINEVHTIGDAFGGMAAQLVALAHGDLEAVSNIQKAMEETRSKEALSYSEFVGHIIDGQEKIKSAGGAPAKDDSIAKQLQASEIAQKILEAAKKTDAEMLASHEDAFTRWIEKWKETEDQLTKLGAAGTEARKAHESVYTAVVNDETQKRIDAATKEATAKASHLAAEIANENEYFALLKVAADQSDNSAAAREDKRYADEQIKWKQHYDKAKADHKIELDEEMSFQAALANIEQEHHDKQVQSETGIVQIRKDLRDGDYSNAMGSAAQMTAGLAAHSRAAFEINKVASLAKATVDGIVMIQASAKDGSDWGGYWGAIAEGALAAAYVAANLDAISSTSYGGGGSVSSGGGGGGIPSQATSPGVPVSVQPAPTGVAAQATQQLNITIIGASANPDAPIISYNTVVNQILPLVQQAANNGHQVNFNVTMS